VRILEGYLGENQVRARKIVACISLLTLTFFLSVTAIEQYQRNERLQRLSDDDWCRQRIAEAFPGFPVISFLGNVTNTAEKLKEGTLPNIALVVEWKSGKHPE
jgi:hypothetical protein